MTFHVSLHIMFLLLLGVHGNWEMQAFAAQLASRHSIILQPAMYLKEVVEGGLLPQKNLKDGHLYMHAVQPTIVSAPQDGVAGRCFL